MRSLKEQIDHQESRRHHWTWSLRDNHIAEKEEIHGPFRGEEQPVIHHSAEKFPDEETIHPNEIENQEKHRNTYDSEMSSAHALYKEASSRTYNNSLRNNFRAHDGTIWYHPHEDLDGENPKNIHKTYDAMDRVTAHPTVRSIYAYRGFHHGLNPTRLPVGHQFVDHGYTGMSLKRHFSAAYSVQYVGNKSSQLDSYKKPQDEIRGIGPNSRITRAVARIHVPAGSYGHFLDLKGHPHSQDFQGEQEFTTKRGSIFQVTGHSSVPAGMHYGHNIHIVHMKLVHQPETMPVRIRK